MWNEDGDTGYLSDTVKEMAQFFRDNRHRVDELATIARSESD